MPGEIIAVRMCDIMTDLRRDCSHNVDTKLIVTTHV